MLLGGASWQRRYFAVSERYLVATNYQDIVIPTRHAANAKTQVKQKKLLINNRNTTNYQQREVIMTNWQSASTVP